ncbi:MAG: 2-oxo acid dehydrogenase subunit E2, partial [Myxococcota bacterium]|nr:2-oxo acid dehydrogenase subunit E2 [Myxococcota bacterium]
TATGATSPGAQLAMGAAPAGLHEALRVLGGQSSFKVPAYTPQPGDKVVPFSRRRRIIADHMVYSKLASPHVVTFAECDLHKTSTLRDKHKDALKKEGVSLTFLAFVSAAVARALREFPVMNARILEDAFVQHRAVNLGIAVETPEGLVVPVIRDADELRVRGIARAIDEIAVKARDGKLVPDDLAGKTFSISNPGRKGNLVGGAIISQPNVGILRIGEIKKRVVVIDHDGQDTIAIHPVMYMALSYDHRVVDGVVANGFLFRVSELLEGGDFEI